MNVANTSERIVIENQETKNQETRNQETRNQKNYSVVLGRSFKVLSSCIQNIAKISFVGFFLLGFIANPLLAAAGTVVVSNPPNSSRDGIMPQVLFREHYMGTAHAQKISVQTTKVKQFEKSLSRFPDPGSQRIIDGSGACSLEGCNVIETQAQCKEKVDTLIRTIVNRKNINLDQIPAEGYLQSYKNTNGKFVEVRYHINKTQYENYIKALRHIEEHFLSEKLPLPNEEQFERLIIETHCTLVYGNPHYKTAHPKEYRTQDMFIPFQTTMKELEKNTKSLDERERGVFNRFVRSPGEKSTTVKKSNNFQEEIRILNKLGFIYPTMPSLIEQEMKEFISNLLHYIKGKSNPIDLASFVHNELVRISPFQEPNDLLARTIMNAILVRLRGDNPVIFQSRERYLQVSFEAVLLNDFKIFSSYLKNEAIPCTEQAMTALA